MVSHPELGSDPPIGSDRESGCDTPCDFDDDSDSLPSTSFSQYLCDDKNNALSIFMLSGSI